MGRIGLLVSDFIISFMWVSSGVFIKEFVHNVLGFSDEPTSEILKSASSILNKFFFAVLARITKGDTYNPLTVVSDVVIGDFSGFLFTIAARIPAQVFGSVAGVRFIMEVFPGIDLDPDLALLQIRSLLSLAISLYFLGF